MGIDGRKWAMQKPNKDDHKNIERWANIARILLTPIMIWVRLYCWVWDYDYIHRRPYKH